MHRRTRFIATITAAALTGGLALAGAGSAHAAVAGDPPMGLMIQVSTLAPTTSPSTLRSWLEDIRRDHHDSTKAGYINTVVLQDIASASGALYTNYLDVLAPYLPGGATPIFTRAYVGTVDLSWTGANSKYIGGIEDPTFRARNVAVSRTAAAAFHARYPKVVNDWYVTYEANLAGFWDTTLAGAYRSYLVQLMGSLSGVVANRQFLWSPAFWTSYANEPAWAKAPLQANLRTLFTGLPSPLGLSIQDFVGQSGGSSTPQTAVTWINYLKLNLGTRVTKVDVNVEQFTMPTPTAITKGSATELPTREAYYRSQGVELGAANEIRYWHARVYG